MKKIIGIIVLGLLLGGCATTDDGANYLRLLKDGKYDGQDTYTFLDGATYVGESKDGKKHGRGTYTFLNGVKYVGEWKDDKQNGLGTYINLYGDKYVGDWKDNKKNGQGTYTWPTGAKYVGDWKDNKSHGRGTMIWANGGKYVGDWKDSKQHGRGTHVDQNGDKYVGEFKDGKKFGQNTYTNTITTADITFTIKDKKKQCEAIGFVTATEKFADCVLRLVELDVKTQQANQIALAQSQGNQQVVTQLQNQRNDQSSQAFIDLGLKLLSPQSTVSAPSTSTCRVIGSGAYKTVKCW